MTAGIVQFANGVAPSAPGAGLLYTYSNATKQFCALNESGFEISDPVVRENEVRAIKPQVSGALAASPSAIANVAGLMLGLSNLGPACIITPQVTGRVLVMVNGVVAQNSTGDGAFWHIRSGTGAAPANGAALVGTQAGGQQSMTFLTGVLSIPFAIETIITGLTLGTAAWLDLVLGTVTGGSATMTQVNLTAFEL